MICHDGIFHEAAREAACKGAEIMARTAGYTAPIREAWRFTNQSNSSWNLMVTANLCMCDADGTFDSMGEAMIVNFDGCVIAHGTTGRADENVTAARSSSRCRSISAARAALSTRWAMTSR
jgi:formamidase